MAFSKKSIYLAGPITGWSYNNARHGWRKTLADIFKDRGADHIECYSPMREKEFLEKDQCIGGEADYQSLHGFGTPQGILTRDHNDVRNCDVMIGCFLGAEKVSIGTCVEFGFAHSYRKPVIMVMEPSRTIVREMEEKRESVPSDVFHRGANAVGDWLVTKGYDIAGGEIKNSFENVADQSHTVLFTIPGKKEIIKNPHDHVFLRACAGYVVPTLEHAADIAQSLLTPGL